MDPEKIGLAAELACLFEVSAEKPGNVTWLQGFKDTCFTDFVVSAVAIGPAFRAAARTSVGETILAAIRATRRLVSANTNLGMVLLMAPLARAAGIETGQGLRVALRSVLRDLTVNDARLAYEAIRLARPGGMGRVNDFDLTETEVNITLSRAMALARDRDAVAREYATDYAVTFEIGLPALHRNLEQGAGLLLSVVQTFLTILEQTPDSLIARKAGRDKAVEVSSLARRVLEQGGVYSEPGRVEIERLNRRLRGENNMLNPGATADLVTAALFVLFLEKDDRF